MQALVESLAAGVQNLDLSPQSKPEPLIHKEFSVSFEDLVRQSQAEETPPGENLTRSADSNESSSNLNSNNSSPNEKVQSDDLKKQEPEKVTDHASDKKTESNIRKTAEIEEEKSPKITPKLEINEKSIGDKVIPAKNSENKAEISKKTERKPASSEKNDPELIKSQSALDRLLESQQNIIASNIPFDENIEINVKTPYLKQDIEIDELELSVSPLDVNVENGLALNISDELTGISGGKNLEIKDQNGNTVKSKLKVEDLRSDKTEIGEKISGIGENSAEKSGLDVEAVLDSKDTATITMSVNNEVQAQNNILTSNAQVAAADGSDFQAMLANQISNNAEDFVKAGKVILRDNDKGTINLVLHPDDLGNVKIQLSLDGKNISGKILVATKEAMEVFKDNAQSLKEAFVNNGFENAGFDVSYSGNGSKEQQFAQENQQILTRNFANLTYGDGDAESGYEYETNRIINSQYSVNIVA